MLVISAYHSETFYFFRNLIVFLIPLQIYCTDNASIADFDCTKYSYISFDFEMQSDGHKSTIAKNESYELRLLLRVMKP